MSIYVSAEALVEFLDFEVVFTFKTKVKGETQIQELSVGEIVCIVL